MTNKVNEHSHEPSPRIFMHQTNPILYNCASHLQDFYHTTYSIYGGKISPTVFPQAISDVLDFKVFSINPGYLHPRFIIHLRLS